jgi:hypothetical protein
MRPGFPLGFFSSELTGILAGMQQSDQVFLSMIGDSIRRVATEG